MFLSEILDERRSHSRRAAEPAKTAMTDSLQGIVYSSEGKRVGLVVEKILDIVEENIQVKAPASRFGVLYTAVIQGRVTELLDMPALLQVFEQNRAIKSRQERVEV
jgi:two-component system chemotaxis sensor kinase CheA